MQRVFWHPPITAACGVPMIPPWQSLSLRHATQPLSPQYGVLPLHELTWEHLLLTQASLVQGTMSSHWAAVVH